MTAMILYTQDFLFEDSIYDAAKRKTTLFIRTRDMPAKRYLGILEEIVGFADAAQPAGLVVGGKSGLHSVLESDRRIVGSQVRSLALCLAAVFLTLCILWRSPRLALVAILVNVPALATVLALHGYARVPLNSVTVMVGAVFLGIAVDNCIHLLSFWQDERERFDDARDELRWVLAHKLGPIACTTAVLVSGLSLFLLSRFPPLADFGLLSILALGVALLAIAVLLPPLLLTIFRPARPAGEEVSTK
jgi:predicted RND superfamily exporter protein